MRYQITAIALAAVLVPGLALAWPWSVDMADQLAIEPQLPARDGEMMPFPRLSIPVGGLPTTISNREEAREMRNPIPVSEDSLHQGRVLFQIYCAACHGQTGRARDETPVAAKIGAIPLVDSYVQEILTEGWIFGTITFGSFLMPAYGVPMGREDRRGANDLSVEERWHVVNYVRNGLVKDAEREATRTAAAE